VKKDCRCNCPCPGASPRTYGRRDARPLRETRTSATTGEVAIGHTGSHQFLRIQEPGVRSWNEGYVMRIRIREGRRGSSPAFQNLDWSQRVKVGQGGFMNLRFTIYDLRGAVDVRRPKVASQKSSNFQFLASSFSRWADVHHTGVLPGNLPKRLGTVEKPREKGCVFRYFRDFPIQFFCGTSKRQVRDSSPRLLQGTHMKVELFASNFLRVADMRLAVGVGN
jgi:hypothetical protein